MRRIVRLLSEANNVYNQAESTLNNALQVWLDQFDFPPHIRSEFFITFVSGGENVVHYGNDEWAYGGVSDIPLERLLSFNREQVIDYFEINIE